MLNTRTLKSLTQFGSALTLMIAVSACSHEQLKDEAQAASIEETSTDFDSPTPDLAAPTTPVPSDENQGLTTPAAKKSSAKKIAKKKKSAHHAVKKHSKKIAKRRKHAKTMVATAGTVDNNVPPAPPADQVPTDVVQNELTIPAPPAAEVAAGEVIAGDVASTSETDGVPLTIALVIGALGALAFAGIKLRKSRGSRRLVFN